MRAKVEIVPRPDVGYMAPGEDGAARERARYQEEMAGELGIVPASRRKPPPRVHSSISGGTVALAIFAAFFTFVLILGLMMWREGRLPRLWPEKGFDFAPKVPTTDWVAGGKRLVPAVPKTTKVDADVVEAPVDAKAEYDAANPKPPPEADDDEPTQN